MIRSSLQLRVHTSSSKLQLPHSKVTRKHNKISSGKMVSQFQMRSTVERLDKPSSYAMSKVHTYIHLHHRTNHHFNPLIHAPYSTRNVSATRPMNPPMAPLAQRLPTSKKSSKTRPPFTSAISPSTPPKNKSTPSSAPAERSNVWSWVSIASQRHRVDSVL